MTDERLAPLTTFLDQPATKKSWIDVAQWLESWENEDELEDEILPAIQDKLEHWSDNLRVAHPKWIDRLLDGEFVPHFYSVRTLNLSCQGILVQEAELLAESPELENITRLLLPYNGLQDEGTEVIANTEIFQNVYHLDLAGNSVGSEGLTALIQSKFMTQLRYLDLTGNWVDNEGAAELADAEHFGNLETLVLRGNPIREDGARALANSNYLADSIKDHWQDHV